MNRTIVVLAAATAAAILPVSASSSSGASLIIRHQVRGCHAWSLDGGAYKASQTARLAPGAALTVIDNDVMPHKLVQLSGPAVTMKPTSSPMTMHGNLTGRGAMNHMGAGLVVKFPRAGTYTFKTQAGEDYMKGMKTVGPDNVLRLTVVVS